LGNREIRPENKDGERILAVINSKGGRREFSCKGGQSFAGEIRNMCNCVLNNAKPLCDEKIGCETTAIVQAAYLSQKMGKKPVTLEEFKKYALKISDRDGEKASETLLKELLTGIGSTIFSS